MNPLRRRPEEIVTEPVFEPLTGHVRYPQAEMEARARSFYEEI